MLGQDNPTSKLPQTLGERQMNCKRCAQGPLEYIYRLDWTDIFYCPDCNLEHKVDIRNNLELVDQNLVSWEEKLF